MPSYLPSAVTSRPRYRHPKEASWKLWESRLKNSRPFNSPALCELLQEVQHSAICCSGANLWHLNYAIRLTNLGPM